MGTGNKYTAQTPNDLESQFDKIARHVYARTAKDDDRNDLLLVLKYKEIIGKSQPKMYEQIVMNRRLDELMSLRRGKDAFAHVWARTQELKGMQIATMDSSSGGQYGRGGRGGWRGRGGGTSSGQPAVKVSVNAIFDGSAGLEGEAHTVEGESDAQVSAAAATGQRGGRGGSSGRGRGRGGSAATACGSSCSLTASASRVSSRAT